MNARDYLLRSAAMLFSLLGSAMPVAAEPDGAKAVAYAAVERNANEIATIGDSVYYFAELGMQEYESAKFVRQVLESIGFTVEAGAAGIFAQPVTATSRGLPSKIGLSVVSISA